MSNNTNSIKMMFNGIEPNERMLKNMIEGKVANVFIAIGGEKNVDYKIVWGILSCYLNYIDCGVYFSIYSKQELDKKFLKKVIYYYKLENYVKLIDKNNKEELLNLLLGCDMALISNKTSNDEISMLRFFGLPILTLDKCLAGTHGDYIYTTKEPEQVVSYINVINNNIDYRNRLTKKSLNLQVSC